MASVTLAPDPYLTVLDTNGNPVSGAKINTYIAGTTTPQATYTDSTGTVANANPIIADSAGRYVAYLLPGASYKFAITDSAGVAIRTQDNIGSVPAASGAQDDTGTAGEALTAGQAVYLSDGSGGKNAGQWYKADSTNTYSSTTPGVGMVPASITLGASGTIRQAGQVTGLSSLTLGADYYVSTAGTITSTAPTNARLLGRADTTSSLVLYGNPPKYGPGSAASLTAHGVVLGQGTSSVTATAAMTTGQLLVGVTGADPVPTAAATAGASMVLLKSGSGTSTAAGATNVDTIAITGLTAADSLFVVTNFITVTQPTASVILQNSTDGVTLATLTSGAMTAGETVIGETVVSQSQASTTSIDAYYTGRGTVLGLQGNVTVAAVTQAWSGSWTLALRHTGVTAGGTLQWRWSVYKIAGQ